MIRRWIGSAFLRVAGWRVEGSAPAEAKVVVIAAPHTSQWDLPFMLAVSYVLGVRASWIGKHTLFRPPFGWFLRRLGGVPVDRRAPLGQVEQIAAEIRRRDRIALAIPPEGTRAAVDHWKSGFYQIARAASVPIALGFLDYRGKRGGFGPTIVPTGDVRADMERIRAFYADKYGRYPEQFRVPRLREEDAGR